MWIQDQEYNWGLSSGGRIAHKCWFSKYYVAVILLTVFSIQFKQLLPQTCLFLLFQLKKEAGGIL